MEKNIFIDVNGIGFDIGYLVVDYPQKETLTDPGCGFDIELTSIKTDDELIDFLDEESKELIVKAVLNILDNK